MHILYAAWSCSCCGLSIMAAYFAPRGYRDIALVMVLRAISSVQRVRNVICAVDAVDVVVDVFFYFVLLVWCWLCPLPCGPYMSVYRLDPQGKS